MWSLVFFFFFIQEKRETFEVFFPGCLFRDLLQFTSHKFLTTVKYVAQFFHSFQEWNRGHYFLNNESFTSRVRRLEWKHNFLVSLTESWSRQVSFTLFHPQTDSNDYWDPSSTTILMMERISAFASFLISRALFQSTCGRYSSSLFISENADEGEKNYRLQSLVVFFYREH